MSFFRDESGARGYVHAPLFFTAGGSLPAFSTTSSTSLWSRRWLLAAVVLGEEAGVALLCAGP